MFKTRVHLLKLDLNSVVLYSGARCNRERVLIEEIQQLLFSSLLRMWSHP